MTDWGGWEWEEERDRKIEGIKEERNWSAAMVRL